MEDPFAGAIDSDDDVMLDDDVLQDIWQPAEAPAPAPAAARRAAKTPAEVLAKAKARRHEIKEQERSKPRPTPRKRADLLQIDWNQELKSWPTFFDDAGIEQLEKKAPPGSYTKVRVRAAHHCFIVVRAGRLQVRGGVTHRRVQREPQLGRVRRLHAHPKKRGAQVGAPD